MADVQFEGEENKSILYSRFEARSEVPKMVAWLMKLGIVKSAASANYVLIAVAIVAIGLSFYFFNLGRTHAPSGPMPGALSPDFSGAGPADVP